MDDGQNQQTNFRAQNLSDQVVAQGQLGVAQPPDEVQGKPPVPPTVPDYVGSVQKEQMPGGETIQGQGERVPLVEIKEEEKIPEDVQGWVEKIQKEDKQLGEPVKVDGQVVVAQEPVVFKDDRIVLPLSQRGLAQNMKKKVSESARWLAEWCGRLIKMLGDRAAFREE